MSVVVVSDTTAINYLILIGVVDVLRDLFGSVYVPRAVLEELSHPRTPVSVRHFASAPPGWLVIRDPQHIDPRLNLDAGENAAIALAEELRADFLLIDERDGRDLAKSRGLHVIGLPNVLDQAAEASLLDLPLVIDALRKTTFRASDSVFEEMLRRHEARSRKPE